MTWAALGLGVFQLPFLLNLAFAWWRGATVGDNPWDATTLEWQASSPPPHGNFRQPPLVRRGAYEYSVEGRERDFVTQTELA
jgi:cytochrome c oxidase subunit 1